MCVSSERNGADCCAVGAPSCVRAAASTTPHLPADFTELVTKALSDGRSRWPCKRAAHQQLPCEHCAALRACRVAACTCLVCTDLVACVEGLQRGIALDTSCVAGRLLDSAVDFVDADARILREKGPQLVPRGRQLVYGKKGAASERARHSATATAHVARVLCSPKGRFKAAARAGCTYALAVSTPPVSARRRPRGRRESGCVSAHVAHGSAARARTARRTSQRAPCRRNAAPRHS